MTDCSCPHNQDSPHLWVPLTEAEIIKIRSGFYVDVHFHGPTFYKNRLNVLIAFRENIPSQDSSIGQALTRLGNVRPVPITDQQLQLIQDADGAFETKLGDGKHSLWITTEKAFNKLSKENKQ